MAVLEVAPGKPGADEAEFFPLPDGYRQDPRWIAPRADYIREDDGEADTAILVRRIEAAYRMYYIQREYADAGEHQAADVA